MPASYISVLRVYYEALTAIFQFLTDQSFHTLTHISHILTPHRVRPNGVPAAVIWPTSLAS